MPTEPNTNGWSEWSRYVLKELERLNNCYEGLHKDVGEIKTEIATLKVKASIWGLAGGLIPAVIVLIYYIIEK
jgi:hypothetical protein